MKHRTTFCAFCKSCIEYSWAILLAFSLVIILFCGKTSWGIKLLNISYSIFAAALFDLFLVYIPNRRKRSLVEELINGDFFRLKECARLCRLSIEPAYPFEEKRWSSEEEYVEQFCKSDLYDVWDNSKGNPTTRLQRIEYLRDEMRHTLDHLMMYREYLSIQEFETLTKVFSSELFNKAVEPIVWEIPERERIHKPDNQEAIGKSIYDVYELLRMCN
ncbi:MAG: hypothetical protein IJA98_02205 [Bacteroidaceae bacterium]|nr:hypothetical protein [Bacteroidaceae bacterium]